MTHTSDTGAPRVQLLHLMREQVDESAFIFVDPEGCIADWSPGAEKLFGYTAEEALGKEFSGLFSPEDRDRGISDLEMAIARSDAISEDDRWHVRKDGSRFWSTGSLTALRDPSATLVGFVKILRDRTNLKEQIERLTHEVEAARAVGRKQEIVMAELSHELRNLFAALSHGLQMIGSAQADPGKRDELARMMREQIALVRRLTDDLLDIERMREGKVSLELEPLTLQDVIARALEVLGPRVAAKHLTLSVFAPGAPLRVNGDAARLYQVFENLIDNAIKYTPAGGHVWVKSTVEDLEAVVHIEDTGIGIPPDMLTKIFELFTQVDTTMAHKGLGIGLSLVRDLVELHGGSVQARSEGVGKGCVFTVRLPMPSTN
jgi:PAS domain S-box-containing protein